MRNIAEKQNLFHRSHTSYHLYFLRFERLVCTHCTRYSCCYYTKVILMRRVHRNSASATIAVGRYHTGVFHN